MTRNSMFRLFSVDDHIIEPRDVWTSRLPSRFRDVGPHVIEEGDREVWIYADERIPNVGLNAVAGRPKEEWNLDPIRFDQMVQACYDPVQRAAIMKDQGVVGSVCFPSLPGFAGRVFYELADKELADLCIRAYNDFVFDEWCAACPEFFVPTTIVQLWDAELAAAEIRRNAARGGRSVSLPDNPTPMGLASIHDPWWDPVWQALEETETVISLHIGASGRLFRASEDTYFTAIIVSGPLMAGCETLADLILSRVPNEFPGLKWVITEGGIGYLPYFLERLDFTWENNREWENVPTDVLPSEIFRRSFWVCAVNETFGLEQRHAIGVDKILWETDFPHAETPWPQSQRAAEKQFAGMSDEDVAKISHMNAQSLFRFAGASW
jgi:predicted TIM-barrel fold metal-dependent hydrolase